MSKTFESKLYDLWRKNPAAYKSELRKHLGVTTKGGMKCVRDAVFNGTEATFADIGEAFLRPIGRSMGNIEALAEEMEYVTEGVGDGVMVPSQFSRTMQGWVSTIQGIIESQVLQGYEEAIDVQQVRNLVEWKTGVHAHELKHPRFAIPTKPVGTTVRQEIPIGNMDDHYVQAPRMTEQSLGLEVSLYAIEADRTTGGIQESARKLPEVFGVVIAERINRMIWGIDNTYKYDGTLTDTYRTTGSYVNKQTNELTYDDGALAIRNAEILLLKQISPDTGREIGIGPGETRTLIGTPDNYDPAVRLARATSLDVGTFSSSQTRAATPASMQFAPYYSQQAVRLMTAATTATPPGLGITEVQANKRWVYGLPKKAFAYDTWDGLQYQTFSGMAHPSLVKQRVMFAIYAWEMGAGRTKEPRFVTLNVKDS